MKRLVTRLLQKFFVDVVQYRETEPRGFRILKYIIIYTIYIGCLGYIIILAQEIATENPHVQTSTQNQPFLPTPVILLSAPSGLPFTLTCSYVKSDNSRQDIVNGTSCNSLIQASAAKNSAAFNGTIFLSRDDVTGLDFQITVNNSSNLTDTQSIGDSDIQMYLFDSTFPYSNIQQAMSDAETTLKAEEIMQENTYFISPHQRHVIWYERIQNKDFDGHKIRNSAGLFAKTTDYYTLSTRFETISPQSNSFGPYATFEIYYQSRIVVVNEQIKDKTVLSLLSSLGGAFGLGMAMYAFCFGQNQNDPWGLSVEFPVIRGSLRRRVMKSFRDTIPLSSETYPESIRDLPGDSPMKIAFEYIDELRKRNHVLEVLLREYVIDIQDVADLMEQGREMGLDNMGERVRADENEIEKVVTNETLIGKDS